MSNKQRMLRVASLLSEARRAETNSDQLQTIIEMRLAAQAFLAFYRQREERHIQKLNPTFD